MGYHYSACYCRECRNMDLNDVYRYDDQQRYCSARRQYYNMNDRACSTYFVYDEGRTSGSGGCYLTTIINEILRMPDDGITLKTLRKFRDEYMLNHPETYPILIEYEIIGPRIANALLLDPEKETIAKGLYEKQIIPIIEDINNKENEKAMQKYQNMTSSLKEFYQVDDTITKKIDVKIKTLGKARAHA